MTDLQQDFLRLLTCFVSERTDDVCPDADRLSALLDLAAKHALSGIAAFQLYRILILCAVIQTYIVHTC